MTQEGRLWSLDNWWNTGLKEQRILELNQARFSVKMTYLKLVSLYTFRSYVHCQIRLCACYHINKCWYSAIWFASFVDRARWWCSMSHHSLSVLNIILISLILIAAPDTRYCLIRCQCTTSTCYSIRCSPTDVIPILEVALPNAGTQTSLVLTIFIVRAWWRCLMSSSSLASA